MLIESTYRYQPEISANCQNSIFFNICTVLRSSQFNQQNSSISLIHSAVMITSSCTILLIFVIFSGFNGIAGSPGDKSPYYQNCVTACHRQKCGNSKEISIDNRNVNKVVILALFLIRLSTS